MAFFDDDLTSGLFFADFGDTLQFGSQVTRGIVDGPGLDGSFGNFTAGDTEYAATVATDSLNPLPKSLDAVTINTGRYAGSYTVRSVDPVEDGGLLKIKLRKR